jgi:hypothetical protein
MSVQYLSDENGQITAVQVPIEEWEKIRNKYPDINQVASQIPDWHKNIVRERLSNYEKFPDQVLDFDTAMDDIEKDL